MKIATLYRFGAAAFILSGFLNSVADFLPPVITRLLNFGGVAFGILGITAVYLYQRRESMIAYVRGVLLFVMASFRARVYPKIPLLFWGLGVMPTPLALVLPAGVITIAELIVSIGIIWIGVVLWQGAATK